MNKLKQLLLIGNSFCIGCRSQEQQDAIAQMLQDEGILPDTAFWINGIESYPCLYILPLMDMYTNQSLDFCQRANCDQYDGNIFVAHPFITYLQELISMFSGQYNDFTKIAADCQVDSMKMYYSSLGSGIWDRKCDVEKILREFYKQFPEFKIDAAETVAAI